jgi:hypothetical protein
MESDLSDLYGLTELNYYNKLEIQHRNYSKKTDSIKEEF